jgi:hypothetical protein
MRGENWGTICENSRYGQFDWQLGAITSHGGHFQTTVDKGPFTKLQKWLADTIFQMTFGWLYRCGCR